MKHTFVRSPHLVVKVLRARNTGTRGLRFCSRPCCLQPTAVSLSCPIFYRFASGILSAVYVAGLVACLVVGTLFGPDVFERSPPAAVETNSLNVTWYGAVNGMERYHQVKTEGLTTQCHSKARCFSHICTSRVY